jgi:hypothetical protein
MDEVLRQGPMQVEHVDSKLMEYSARQGFG